MAAAWRMPKTVNKITGQSTNNPKSGNLGNLPIDFQVLTKNLRPRYMRKEKMESQWQKA